MSYLIITAYFILLVAKIHGIFHAIQYYKKRDVPSIKGYTVEKHYSKAVTSLVIAVGMVVVIGLLIAIL